MEVIDKVTNNAMQKITNRDVLLILSGFAVGTSVGSIAIGLFLNNVGFLSWMEGFLQNFSTEMFGGFVTFLLIEVLVVSRKEREARERRRRKARLERRKEQEATREDLLRRVASRVNTEAVRASEELRHHGWLEDGTLDDAKLSGANLANANFARARLRRVRFHKANLSEASFYQADLRGVFLVGADASEAIFRGADLTGAYLQGATLTGCASLTDKQLARVARLKGATMPDGTRYDGRYRLPGDLKQARDKGATEYDPEAMAAYYKVPLEVYEAGQDWADDHLFKYRDED